VIQVPADAVDPCEETGKAGTMEMAFAQSRPSPRANARPELVGWMCRVAENQDREAFRQLFMCVGPSVKGMLLRQGTDAASAEEIVQETFLTVWRKAGLYSSERGNVTTWIYTIARNLRIDRVRREVPWQELGENHLEQASEEPLQDEALASQQIQARMQAVLSTLPEEQIEIVHLAYAEGLSHGEIALRLKLPLGTVKSRMRLAYQKIKTSFQDAS
jgi:RNA polymerase sigma-70 factor (ECF subfamily)